jgi:hypothetical protein
MQTGQLSEATTKLEHVVQVNPDYAACARPAWYRTFVRW